MSLVLLAFHLRRKQLVYLNFKRQQLFSVHRVCIKNFNVVLGKNKKRACLLGIQIKKGRYY